MKIKRIILICCLFAVWSLFHGCNNVGFDHQLKYQTKKSYFSPEFTNHFPDSLTSLNHSTVSDTTNAFDHVRFTLNVKLTLSEYYELNKNIEKQSIAKYNSSDTCLLIVNKYTTNENWHKSKKVNDVEEIKFPDCSLTKYPIPNFWTNALATDETNCKLPRGFSLYVLEAKPGIYGKPYQVTTGKYMPESWKNGYSKGIALSKNDKTAIYWFIMW